MGRLVRENIAVEELHGGIDLLLGVSPVPPRDGCVVGGLPCDLCRRGKGCSVTMQHVTRGRLAGETT